MELTDFYFKCKEEKASIGFLTELYEWIEKIDRKQASTISDNEDKELEE